MVCAFCVVGIDGGVIHHIGPNVVHHSCFMQHWRTHGGVKGAEMVMIAATRPKECNDCKKEVKVVDQQTTDGVLTIITECKGCEIRYTSTFRL